MKVLPFSGPPYDSWRFLTGTLFDYLGATVIAVDLNQDGLDDIIAGAPLFSNNARERGDIGRIYVYVNQQKVLNNCCVIMRSCSLSASRLKRKPLMAMCLEADSARRWLILETLIWTALTVSRTDLSID